MDESRQSPNLVTLMESIEAHWSCADGPARAWFKVDGEQHPYIVYGYAAMGQSAEIERELCDALFEDLKRLNRGGLLLFRRRPFIEFDPLIGATNLTVRLAFFGGETLNNPEAPRSFMLLKPGAEISYAYEDQKLRLRTK